MNINNNFTTITFEIIDDKIGILSINRPEKLNALNSQVLNELKEILTQIKESRFSLINGLIITGTGEKSFIAGADILEMTSFDSKKAKDFAELGQEVSLLIENLQITVIAAVNGFALGGGCEMACSADFIFSTENAIFGQPEVKLGLIPGFGGTQRLGRLIGRNKAKEVIYTGRNFNSEEALRNGLVNAVFKTKEELIIHSKKVISKISKNSLLAVSLSKDSLNRGIDETITKGLDCEKDNFSFVFNSSDMKEGTTAFLEKKRPRFQNK
ncbi:MAG: enoyl-CoA hydratase/isomerase family protein [Bdellovibrionales bacterium]|nr:enoyl-CoA hydratase/isomerase family protein [Bdellovibrionales bacterium]